jgi:hypothetical protein
VAVTVAVAVTDPGKVTLSAESSTVVAVAMIVGGGGGSVTQNASADPAPLSMSAVTAAAETPAWSSRRDEIVICPP